MGSFLYFVVLITVFSFILFAPAVDIKMHAKHASILSKILWSVVPIGIPVIGLFLYAFWGRQEVIPKEDTAEDASLAGEPGSGGSEIPAVNLSKAMKAVAVVGVGICIAFFVLMISLGIALQGKTG